MNSYPLSKFCIICFDDNSNNKYRKSILQMIFQLNNYKLSDDNYIRELEGFEKNPEYINKYKIQNSIYFIQYNNCLTFDIINNKFKTISNENIKLLLISNDKCVSNTKFLP